MAVCFKKEKTKIMSHFTPCAASGGTMVNHVLVQGIWTWANLCPRFSSTKAFWCDKFIDRESAIDIGLVQARCPFVRKSGKPDMEGNAIPSDCGHVVQIGTSWLWHHTRQTRPRPYGQCGSFALFAGGTG